jgi:hypothetical protein
MSNHLDNHVIPPSRQREKPRDGLTWLGKSMKRVEDPRILSGKGRYIDDIVLPNMGMPPFCAARMPMPASSRSTPARPKPCRV